LNGIVGEVFSSSEGSLVVDAVVVSMSDDDVTVVKCQCVRLGGDIDFISLCYPSVRGVEYVIGAISSRIGKFGYNFVLCVTRSNGLG
jgi:hypothetical protein